MEASAAAISDLIGTASGPVLDLGCGTGLYTPILAGGDRNVIGIEVSRDQLAIARTRNPLTLQADAHRLPFRAGSFNTVAALWVTTDMDDIGTVLLEASRVLAGNGLLLLFGVHPCFNGPMVENRADGARIIHPTYRKPGYHEASPWWGAEGVRHRVGMRHVPLANLLNAVIGAGLVLERVTEPREDPIPAALAVLARKPTRSG
jgi:SAM-dependent methyltransferase